MDPRISIGQIRPKTGSQVRKDSLAGIGLEQAKFGPLFQQALQKQADGPLKISAHAEKRLQERNIDLDPKLMMVLNNALDELKGKGARDSLVVTGDGAFVVNVPTRTLVTAMDVREMRDRIVTQIDSVSLKYG